MPQKKKRKTNREKREEKKKRRLKDEKLRRITEHLNRIMEKGVVTPAQEGGNPGGADYLKPWSDKYGMPEYDLE